MVRISIAFALSLFLLGLVVPAGAEPRSFHVEVTGSGPPVVFIPGLACSGEVWAGTVARYRRTHQLHVLTLAGFGGQPAVPTPSLKTVRDELLLYIREHRLNKPIIVGHSIGGFVALWLGSSAPEQLGGLVVVDALPFLPAAQDPTATADSVRSAAQSLRDQTMQLAPAAFSAQSRSALGAMITRPKDIEAVARFSNRSDQKTVAMAMFELMTTDLRVALGAVRVPTLVLAAAAPWGVESVRAIYRTQYAGLTTLQLVLAEGARHFIMLDDPPFFYAQLDGVLGSGR